MSLKTYVGFVADFPSDRGDDDSPAGKKLADFVASQLKNAGIDVRGPEERDGWAWELTSQIDSTAIDTIVGLVDDMNTIPPRQWLITNDSNLTVWQRLFGTHSFREQCEKAMRRYCETLHRSLAPDPRFSHLLWYNKATFDKPGDEPGDSP